MHTCASIKVRAAVADIQAMQLMPGKLHKQGVSLNTILPGSCHKFAKLMTSAAVLMSTSMLPVYI